jgi:hypothetical protein
MQNIRVALPRCDESEAEGHKVIQKGQRYFVADYERALMAL